jgi:ribosomal-protein-alanine N-acetyltransferase
MRYIGTGEVWIPQRAEEVAAAQRAHWAEHGFGWFAAVDRERDQAVGLIALNFAGDGGAGLDPCEYELGWWLAPQAWGHGYASEGATAMRDYALRALNAPGVIARIQPSNAPSIRVAEGLGLALDFNTTGRFQEPIAIYRAARPASDTN